jgi:HSP20 family protein
MAETTALAPKEAAAATTPESTRGDIYYTPRVDICETDEELVLACDMPGVKPDDLDLRFDKGELLLHGKVRPRPPAAELVRHEYGVGDFYRSFAISEAVDAGKITAEYKHGVLTVHLPKKEEVKPKRIAIKAE